ncbi:MAG: peptidoglycan editing factor PgeF [Ktedonobacteraceae bacterium]|nr:peptidoglycan editing factor PgeF [Ktedonobacteraceae bacterium]
MIRHEHAQPYENLVYYSYQLFEPFPQMSCVISTRLGGVSEGYSHSLNLSFSVGDTEQAVLTNRSRLYHIVDVEPQSVAQAHLVHGNYIEIVTSQSPTGTYRRFAETDGLVTNVIHKPLLILVADCAAVAFFDPKQHVIALLHAGWKGIVSNIVAKMVSTMHETFGCRPSDMLAAISPSLGPCCYEVREDLVAAFHEAFPAHAQDLFRLQPDTSIHLDMWAALRYQLRESGIRPEYIEESGLCTACHLDEFYSHRAERGKTGRFAGLIVLRSAT